MPNNWRLNVTHVPYRGGSQGINDVVGGHVDMMYAGVAAGKGAIDNGGVRALAVTGDKRSSALPNVPTIKEAGVPEFDLASWNVLLAPKDTPSPILSLLRKEALDSLKDPAFREALSRLGVEQSERQDVRAFLLVGALSCAPPLSPYVSLWRAVYFSCCADVALRHRRQTASSIS